MSSLTRLVRLGTTLGPLIKLVMQAGRNLQAISDAVPAFSGVRGASDESES